MLNIIADASAPASEAENREFCHVIATGFQLSRSNYLIDESSHQVKNS